MTLVFESLIIALFIGGYIINRDYMLDKMPGRTRVLIQLFYLSPP